MPYTEFHYTPTGTGVISGKEVLEQTEDAINDLGTQISGDVQTAIDTANNALNTANQASTDAQNAVNTANTAYTTATNAQNTANTAQNTASNALTAAQNAQNDVNALGNRVTTAENNISQNTSDISGLTTRMGTAEGNITNLQNDVVTAQGTATSAQNTATMARQQAYVLRYSSTAITDNSTIAYRTLDNTDNIKSSDKIIDTDGKIFSIVSVDSANETVTVGSALIDLALDSNVMHLSGNETVEGIKTFSDVPIFATFDGIRFRCSHNSSAYVTFRNANQANPGSIIFSANDGNVGTAIHLVNKTLIPYTNGDMDLGTSLRKWKSLNGINPGALSFPDLSAGLDISGYITVPNTSNTYTPTVNGWISIILKSTSGALACFVYQGDHANSNYSATSLPNETEPCVMCTLPVVKNVAVSIDVKGSNAYVASAKFYPCLGNV